MEYPDFINMPVLNQSYKAVPLRNSNIVLWTNRTFGTRLSLRVDSQSRKSSCGGATPEVKRVKTGSVETKTNTFKSGLWSAADSTEHSWRRVKQILPDDSANKIFLLSRAGGMACAYEIEQNNLVNINFIYMG